MLGLYLNSLSQSLGAAYAKSAMPFLLKLQAFRKIFLLTTNLMTDIRKFLQHLIKSCRTHTTLKVCLTTLPADKNVSLVIYK
jgi:hypothetical protein